MINTILDWKLTITSRRNKTVTAEPSMISMINFRQNLITYVHSRINTFLKMSYLTDSYIGFTLEMKSVTKNTIFGLKMMVKSGLKKFILKSLHTGR